MNKTKIKNAMIISLKTKLETKETGGIAININPKNLLCTDEILWAFKNLYIKYPITALMKTLKSQKHFILVKKVA